MKEYLENTTSKKLDVLSTENFYQPLGTNNTMYNPIGKISKNRIISNIGYALNCIYTTHIINNNIVFGNNGGVLVVSSSATAG
mgnify:CR=1 FL=1